MGIHEKVSISTWGHMTKWKEQHCSMWINANISISIHDQVWTSTCWYFNEGEWKYGVTRPSVNINTKYLSNWEYQYEWTWLSENSNKGSHDQMRISMQVYMTKGEYQHSYTWLNLNLKMGTHDQVSFAAQWYLDKYEYQDGDTLPFESINMVIL